MAIFIGNHLNNLGMEEGTGNGPGACLQAF